MHGVVVGRVAALLSKMLALLIVGRVAGRYLRSLSELAIPRSPARLVCAGHLVERIPGMVGAGEIVYPILRLRSVYRGGVLGCILLWVLHHLVLLLVLLMLLALRNSMLYHLVRHALLLARRSPSPETGRDRRDLGQWEYAR